MIAVYDLLAKILYDEERDVEYAPLCCMNDENIAKRIQIPGAKPVIYVISASASLNSAIAFEMKNILVNKRIDLLDNVANAKDEILYAIPEYVDCNDAQIEFWYERPFLETQLLLNEMSNLLYEKLEQTGLVRIYETSTNRKDRYTSLSYGNYFISKLEKDLFKKVVEEHYTKAPNCITALTF